MKILILGSKGFIGQNAYNFFSKKYEVIGADIIKSSEANYYTLNKDLSNIKNLFCEHSFKFCINASGNGSVPISIKDPEYDFSLNTINTFKILEAIRLYNSQCNFINISSAAVYGNPLSLPIKEDSLLRPLSPYGWHKLYSENICSEYNLLYGINTINLRPFSVYGEYLRKQIFWDIYQKSKLSTKIELLGSGYESRDFIYIKDLLYAFECIIMHCEFKGQAMNVGSGEELTISEVAKFFSEQFGSYIDICFNSKSSPGNPLNWKADITELQSLGFKPKFSFQDGLKNTIKWLKENE